MACICAIARLKPSTTGDQVAHAATSKDDRFMHMVGGGDLRRLNEVFARP
jgi:hypothetical protein